MNEKANFRVCKKCNKGIQGIRFPDGSICWLLCENCCLTASIKQRVKVVS